MVHDVVNNNEVNGSRRFHFGILALQGAFQEHIHMLQNIPQVSSATPIRKVEQLATIDALIIPGGESTTMALVAERSGLMEPLREFVRSGKPTWGTCAGMILLANEANKTKKGGQSLIGGLDITIDSFESTLRIEHVTTSSDDLFPAVFIRAPIISSINNPDIEVLARLEYNVDETDISSIVAVKQDNLLATAFHPELTNDDRIHKYFVQITQDYYYSGKKEK
ncbi:12845_t:CDS:2 [Funneliformis geosporum]|uniref:glutaminase n=1 Tax=Funneliformis geosporum TaxID=1117311 RepID=A0A9W4SKH8_9GLOM|nr:10187_t:CDS:2 [Funneliformis geosporum]CAI2175083.1 12845_t:CDS:2 [Funneliformis geosporum]